MSRALNPKNFRLVGIGDSRGIHRLWAEYVVLDGDLPEAPQKLDFDEVDFSQSIDSIWKSAVEVVKSHENL